MQHAPHGLGIRCQKRGGGSRSKSIMLMVNTALASKLKVFGQPGTCLQKLPVIDMLPDMQAW